MVSEEKTHNEQRACWPVPFAARLVPCLGELEAQHKAARVTKGDSNRVSAALALDSPTLKM